MQTGDICIRQALHSDMDYILEELKRFSEFFISEKSMYPKDDAVAAKIVGDFIDNHLFLMADRSYQDKYGEAVEPVGFIAGFITPHFFNPDLIQLTELFWWVGHKWRQTGAGRELMNAFVAFGKDNCDFITVTLQENSQIEESSVLGYGFKALERGYFMEV